ncbi:hypothetical protein SUGI_1148110 [Cryptomeria japonica]|nr:hypothetical protein SUGI_1148110 [Cryptomeria japonica]
MTEKNLSKKKHQNIKKTIKVSTNYLETSTTMLFVVTVLQSAAGAMSYADAAKVLTTTTVDSSAMANATIARILQSIIVGSSATLSIVVGSSGQF